MSAGDQELAVLDRGELVRHFRRRLRETNAPMYARICAQITRLERLSAEERNRELARSPVAVDWRAQRLLESGIEGEALTYSLDACPARTASQRAAISALVETRQHWNALRVGVCLVGPAGSGKTSAMSALVCDVIRRAKPIPHVLFVSCQEIREVMKRMDLEYAIRMLGDGKRRGAVVFDDIQYALDPPGSKWHSDADRIIRGAVNWADRAKKILVFATTNLPLRSAGKDYRGEPEPSIANRYGGAFADRLGGLMRWIEMSGPSYRQDERPYWAYD